MLVDAVSAKQTVLKKHSDLAKLGLAVAAAQQRDFEAGQQVVAAVAAQHPERNLAAGQHHGFTEGSAQHKTQRTGAVGHGVGTVQHHKTVEFVASGPQGVGHRNPVVGAHI